MENNKQGMLNDKAKARRWNVVSDLYEVGPLRLQDKTLKTVKAYINRSHLRHNAAMIRSRLGRGTQLCAVVKANGYGHDSKVVVSCLNQYADAYAVSTIEEAEQIYPFVQGKTILATCPLFSGIDPSLVRLAQIRGFHCSMCSLESLRYLESYLSVDGPALKVHLKVDTGMGRLGSPPDEAIFLYQRLLDSPKIELAGVYTHFSTADDDLDYAHQQQRDFERFLALIAEGAPRPCLRHACNTSGLMRMPSAHYDMVRCGIGLYGLVNCEGATEFELKPVLHVEAPVVQVKTLRQGCTCGYGRTFTTPRDMVVGIIPVGYADGLLRSLSNQAILRMGNYPVSIIGRISMDLTIVDLSQVPNPREGMTVTVIDDQKGSPCHAKTLADQAGTIPYEILVSIGNRIKRVLVD